MILPSLARRSFAEFLGTFVLVFAGTGAIVVNDATHAITHAGIAITFGLVVLALIYCLGDISGAHFNPAVTLGFVFAQRFPLQQATPYIAVQILGALAASGLLKFLFPENLNLGATRPTGSGQQSFIFEVILTWFLMLTILSVSTGAKEKGITAGIAIGAIIALEAMFAGPISGASMNPARSIGPAIISGNLLYLELYLVAPVLGAVLAVPTFAIIREPAT